FVRLYHPGRLSCNGALGALQGCNSCVVLLPREHTNQHEPMPWRNWLPPSRELHRSRLVVDDEPEPVAPHAQTVDRVLRPAGVVVALDAGESTAEDVWAPW